MSEPPSRIHRRKLAEGRPRLCSRELGANSAGGCGPRCQRRPGSFRQNWQFKCTMMRVSAANGAAAAGVWVNTAMALRIRVGACCVGLLASLVQPALAQTCQCDCSLRSQTPPISLSRALWQPLSSPLGGTKASACERGRRLLAACWCACATCISRSAASANPGHLYARRRHLQHQLQRRGPPLLRPTPGGDVDSMVDLTGMAYGALPTRSISPDVRATAPAAALVRTEQQRRRAYMQGRVPDVGALASHHGAEPPRPTIPASCRSRQPIVREDYPTGAIPQTPVSVPYRY